MIRSRAVKRAYFTLTYTAMHAHAVRRRTAPVSYVRRHAPYGALYGYCIKTYKFFLSNFAAPASCRCRLRSRAVKRAYFTLTYTAMHAHAVRRRTAPVSYVRRHAPCGALYGYCIKIYKFFFSIKLCRT